MGQLGDVLRFSAQDVAAQGYDNDTGWGLMNIAGALAAPEPVNDPIEPNDDIVFVDGRAFTKPDAVRWGGVGTATLSATSDQVEDPADVYRIRLKPRSRSRISLTTSFGQAQVRVFDRTAKTIYRSRGRVCAPSTTGCVLNYRGRKSPLAYVVVDGGRQPVAQRELHAAFQAPQVAPRRRCGVRPVRGEPARFRPGRRADRRRHRCRALG